MSWVVAYSAQSGASARQAGLSATVAYVRPAG